MTIKVLITRLVDASFPGFVECEFVDGLGVKRLFVEKSPVVALDPEKTAYPQAGVIACEISRTLGWDASGRSIVEIDTTNPWSVEASDGSTRFCVFRDQLVEFPD